MCWVYDGLRVLRNLIKHSRRILNIEDIFYCLFMTVALFYLLYTYHRGEIRNYILVGLMSGYLFYYKTISPVYVALWGAVLKPFKIMFVKIHRILGKMMTKSRDKH